MHDAPDLTFAARRPANKPGQRPNAAGCGSQELATGRDRNESLDCLVLALAALRVTAPTPARFEATAAQVEQARTGTKVRQSQEKAARPRATDPHGFHDGRKTGYKDEPGGKNPTTISYRIQNSSPFRWQDGAMGYSIGSFENEMLGTSAWP
jgi:hypothetical protein